jgi:predicted dehydrogenase
VEDFAQTDDYLNQADSFSRRIRHLESKIECPVPPSDAIGNARTLDAIFKSAASGKRVTIG